MPLFDFACEDCGAELELLVSRDSTPTCPECDGTSLKKMLSVFAVGKAAAKKGHTGCGGPDDCIGNRAAKARALGKATCC